MDVSTFSRRIFTYRAFIQAIDDLLNRLPDLKRAARGGRVSKAFSERIMLAVTQVNGCRYCSYFHAQQALTEGISETEIRAIGDGLFDKCPAEELTALCYAQHWAETDTHPTPEARARLLETYGEETVAQMDLALRMIRIGNLTGNLLDYILFRLSFGLINIDQPVKSRK